MDGQPRPRAEVFLCTNNFCSCANMILSKNLPQNTLFLVEKVFKIAEL